MAHILLITLAVFLAVLDNSLTNSAKIPDYIHICHRNDPKLNDCIRNTVHDLRPYLVDGIKELNVPAMDPLYIGDLNVLDGGQGGFTVKTKNLNIYGAANFEITKFNTMDEGKRFEFDLILPRLNGEGNYDISGQILALPIKGNGPFSGNFTNFTAFVRVKFDIKKDDKDVSQISVKSLDVKIKVGKGRVRLSNLFNGDKALGDVINDTINQNFETFTTELIPHIEKALEKKFIAIARKIMDTFTYDDLFPL